MSNPSSPSLFRPDIEGLRAIAVMLVVASHANLPGLKGGYIGVDVFFVISGFLITTLLHAEWTRSGSIDILAFYGRRLRRLMPAFALMLAFVVLATRVVYAPTEQPQMLQSAFAATLYFSNIHYALEATNYLAPQTRFDPVLHTWSLGVEEQFYLVWPLILLLAGLLARHNKGRLDPFVLLVGGLLLPAFLACIYLTTTHQPLAFFMPFTRAWEFSFGALVALCAARWLVAGAPLARLLARSGVANALTLLALALIVGAGIGLTETSTFPGVLALLPVTGTALLILLVPAAPAGTLVGRLLALPPLQWVGKLSYSWYLWHWPLLVVGRVLLPESTLATDLTLAIAGLVMAQVSYTLVEHPVRMASFFQRKAAPYALALVIAASGITAIQATSDAATKIATSDRFGRLMAVANDLPIIYQYPCDPMFDGVAVVECVGGDQAGSKTAVLLGDSHAGQWFSALHDILRQRGWKLIVMTKSACAIVDEDFFYPRLGRTYTECRVWRERAVQRIQALKPELLIVANSENYTLTQPQWQTGLRRLLPVLADASGQLVVLRDTPLPGFTPAHCLARQEWNPRFTLRDCTFDPARGLSPSILDAYQAVANSRADIHILDMTPEICSESPCQVRTGTLVKYRDSNHLSDTFVRSLAPAMAAGLSRAGAF